jgi:hypothetical protein
VPAHLQFGAGGDGDDDRVVGLFAQHLGGMELIWVG